MNKGDPPNDAVVRIANIIEKLQELDRSTIMEPPKALCGRGVNVIIWEEALWKLITSAVHVGDFVRLRNVEARIWRDGRIRCKFISRKILRTRDAAST